jgi:mono/diheme cytochrome c family protein
VIVSVRQPSAVVVVALLALGLTVFSASSLGAVKPSAPTAQSSTAAGMVLYRKYCGQCHALSQALAAGFGNNSKGIGANGGPSFNNMRIPFALSVSVVEEPTGGHEAVKPKIAWAQLKTVATYLARATSRNPLPALPTDG